jgi:hypothetical protein
MVKRNQKNWLTKSNKTNPLTRNKASGTILRFRLHQINRKLLPKRISSEDLLMRIC